MKLMKNFIKVEIRNNLNKTFLLTFQKNRIGVNKNKY